MNKIYSLTVIKNKTLNFIEDQPLANYTSISMVM